MFCVCTRIVYFQVAKKLAGHATGTAAWATNVGNEHGQVLMCVLTAAEGAGLTKMAAGLQRRYETAGQSPPTLMYVDRDCCSSAGDGAVARMFCGWPDLAVRLDVWHFVRRFCSACTTDTHPLYSVFLSKLSTCIFEWDAGDLARLREAKEATQVQLSAYVDVSQQITRKELERHCRRRTRGADETTRLIQALIDVLDSPSGCDTMGVRLFDHERIQAEWAVLQRHVGCIQDVAGFQLYRQTGTLKKGGIQLPVYRCARGSTSLESFHRHLVHFVPGNDTSY